MALQTKSPLHDARHLGVAQGNNRINNVPPISSQAGAQGDAHQYFGTIQNNDTINVLIPGLFFYITVMTQTASGLSIRALRPGQTGSFISYFQGTGFMFGASGAFASLQISNTSGGLVSFTMIVGGGAPTGRDEYIDKRVVLNQNAGGVSTNLFVANGTTFGVGYKTRVPAWGDSLAAGVTQDIPDGYLGKSRKSILLANDDAIAVLQVLDSTGNIIGTIQPSTSWAQECAGDIKLKNPSANPVTCHIGEVYYN